MLLRVKLFAAMRDLTGDEVAEVELPDGATVGDLRRELGKHEAASVAGFGIWLAWPT